MGATRVREGMDSQAPVVLEDGEVLPILGDHLTNHIRELTTVPKINHDLGRQHRRFLEHVDEITPINLMTHGPPFSCQPWIEATSGASGPRGSHVRSRA
jgi:hypothetical protein